MVNIYCFKCRSKRDVNGSQAVTQGLFILLPGR